MTWLFRYKIRHFFQESFWLFPVLGILIALIVGPILRWADPRISFHIYVLQPEGARALIGPLAASLFTFVVFVISTMLLLAQLASGNLTPRVIHFVFNDTTGKIVLGLFTLSFTLSLEALGRIEQTVPLLQVNVAIFVNLLSFALFFFFVQNVGRKLLPTLILENWAQKGKAVIHQMFPNNFSGLENNSEASHISRAQSSSRSFNYHGPSGNFLAFGIESLVEEARRHKGRIEILPQIGDFVSRGDPFFRVSPAQAAWSESRLFTAVAIGPERTVEQDPPYAFRLIVDVASKALSPGINDPTTAVMAIDHLQGLLKLLGGRELDSGEARDIENQLRLTYATTTWAQYVSLAVTEIRIFGVQSIQIPRRLQAMLEDLIAVLPASRHPPLQEEMGLLRELVQRHYLTTIDQNRALKPDLQGLGGREIH